MWVIFLEIGVVLVLLLIVVLATRPKRSAETSRDDRRAAPHPADGPPQQPDRGTARPHAPVNNDTNE